MFALFAIISHIGSRSLSFRITYVNGYIKASFLFFCKRPTARPPNQTNTIESKINFVFPWLGLASAHPLFELSFFSFVHRSIVYFYYNFYQCHKGKNKRQRTESIQKRSFVNETRMNRTNHGQRFFLGGQQQPKYK